MSEVCYSQGAFWGFDRGDAVGWIRDTRDNTALAEVRFVAETGASLSWRPTFCRPAVCAEIGQQGLFGFAAPIAALAQIGQRFAVTDSDGNILTDGEFSLPTDADERSTSVHRSPPAHMFLHIPKTAGTSVTAALYDHTPQSRYAAVYGGGQWLSLEQFAGLPLHQRQELDLVVGHLYFGWGSFIGKPCRYITFLRDPMERVESQYWHYVNNGISTIQVGKDSFPLHEVVNEGMTEDFDNLQIRMIAGVSNHTRAAGQIDDACAAAALNNLRNDFAFVGFFDTLDTDFGPLLSVLGMPSRELAHLNVTPLDSLRRKDNGNFRKIDWDQVRRRHAPEIAFYADAQRLRTADKESRQSRPSVFQRAFRNRSLV